MSLCILLDYCLDNELILMYVYISINCDNDTIETRLKRSCVCFAAAGVTPQKILKAIALLNWLVIVTNGGKLRREQHVLQRQ